MDPTTALFTVAGVIIGASLGFAFLSSRAFDRKHPEAPRG